MIIWIYELILGFTIYIGLIWINIYLWIYDNITNTNTYTILYPIPHQSPSIPSPAVHLQALPQRRLQRLRGSASALLPAQGTLQLGAGGLLLGHGDFNQGKMGKHDNGFLWDCYGILVGLYGNANTGLITPPHQVGR